MYSFDDCRGSSGDCKGPDGAIAAKVQWMFLFFAWTPEGRAALQSLGYVWELRESTPAPETRLGDVNAGVDAGGGELAAVRH